MARIRSKLTYANVVASLALFVALGGSSYAAIKVSGKNIRNNTVASADLKNNDVRTRDVRNGSLLRGDFKAGELPEGPRGPQGQAGATGPRGPQGLRGPSGPGAIKLLLDVDQGQTTVQAGPWTIKADCAALPGTDVRGLYMEADLPGSQTGEAQWSGSNSTGDANVDPIHGGLPVGPSGVNFGRADAVVDGTYARIDRVAYLRSGSQVTVVELNGYADARSASSGCKVLGHVIPMP